MKENRKTPAAITIFGGKGDLTNRKLIPALYNLYINDHLPERFRIFCVDYLTVREDQYKSELHEGVNTFSRSGKADSHKWAIFAGCITYLQGDFMKMETFVSLKASLDAFDKKNRRRGVRLFYYAVAPRFIEPISESVYKQKICSKKSTDRIVVEKPFGTDLQSARKLNSFLKRRFAEQQIYRIDHYLGKETVQNIMAFRFANYVFEPIWNRKYINHIEISLAEEVGVGTRGGYYDSSGALRDMIQNHLMQLLCIVAMECPSAYEAEKIRNAKTKLLQSLRKYSEADVWKNIIRGQYSKGTIDGNPVPAYRSEPQVGAHSETETFVAGKFFVDNDRWKGVPFFLSTGKCLARQSSVIMVQFKDSPHKIFKDDIMPNKLIISIQPELEISLLFESKIPGLLMKLKPVKMDFTYQESYTESLPEAYEALLLDVLEGDATLFMRADQVDAAWQVVMPIINAWRKNPSRGLHLYKPGGWGPKATTRLIHPYAMDWFHLPENKKAE